MKGILRKILNGERGQVLPIVLALLAFGGLTIASSLSYVSTGLNSGRIVDERIKGVYAAEAGIEDALWAIRMGYTPPQQLAEPVNGMNVSIQYESQGIYTIYLGEMVALGVHNPYLDVDGDIVWDEGVGKYKYTITVTWLPEPGAPTIHLAEVGARLPFGYSYDPGSAGLFEENLSTEPPAEFEDEVGACMLNWVLASPLPDVSEEDPTETQTFYFGTEGEYALEGSYAWVVANREDVGAVGEITGNLYHLTSTASSAGDGRTMATIDATVISENATLKIVSWRQTP